MRVLAVTNLYPTIEHPYAGTFVEQQVQSLKRSGVDVELLLADRQSRGVVAYSDLRKSIRKSSAIRGFDLVHAMYGGVLAYLAGREVGGSVPFVVSFCGSDLLGEPLGNIRRRVSAGVGIWCSRKAAQKADGIIVKASSLLRALPSGIEGTKTAIIPNGVDLTRFRDLDRGACLSALGWSATDFHVLFPANGGDPIKRFPLARAAVEELRDRGVAARLHRLESVPHDQVPTWLNAADALVVTSLHEGSPNVVKEAMACRLPVVSVDVGDVRQRIENVPGCYICEATSTSVAQGLLRVARRGARADSRQAAAELSVERVAARINEFYDKTVARWRSRER